MLLVVETSYLRCMLLLQSLHCVALFSFECSYTMFLHRKLLLGFLG